LRLTVSPARSRSITSGPGFQAKKRRIERTGSRGFLHHSSQKTKHSALTLPAGGSSHSETLAGNSPLQTGYAALTVPRGSGPYGTAVFSLTQDNVVVSECGVPASPPGNSVRLFVDNGTRVMMPSAGAPVDILTGIALVNRGTGSANIIFILRGRAGPLAGGRPRYAGRRTHRARFLNQLQELAPDFALPADFSTITRFGTLDVAADQPLSVLALRMTVNQRGNTLFTSVPVADLTKTPSTLPLYFPQITDGDGYTTSIILLNTTTNSERNPALLRR